MHLNQNPIFDHADEKPNIFWLGLSAVMMDGHKIPTPLSPTTRTGSLIADIEEPFADSIAFYKTNLVKCVPLNADKIRYPLQHEMEKCFPNFMFELGLLQPKIVFLLGKQVADFVIKKLADSKVVLDENYSYKPFIIENIKFIPVHHPSFILVYKRKEITNYIAAIQSFFKSSKGIKKRA